MSAGGARPSAATRAADTVLVVDKDVLVRLAIAAYLRDCGYRVIEAASADEAVAVVENEGERLEAVLADVDTGGSLDGFALARWVRTRRPGLPVILSATPARTAAAAGEICEQGPMLAKPYDPQLVVERIRLLRASRPPA